MRAGWGWISVSRVERKQMRIGQDPFIGGYQREVVDCGRGDQHAVGGVAMEFSGKVVGGNRDLVGERDRVG